MRYSDAKVRTAYSESTECGGERTLRCNAFITITRMHGRFLIFPGLYTALEEPEMYSGNSSFRMDDGKSMTLARTSAKDVIAIDDSVDCRLSGNTEKSPYLCSSVGRSDRYTSIVSLLMIYGHDLVSG